MDKVKVFDIGELEFCAATELYISLLLSLTVLYMLGPLYIMQSCEVFGQ